MPRTRHGLSAVLLAVVAAGTACDRAAESTPIPVSPEIPGTSEPTAEAAPAPEPPPVSTEALEQAIGRALTDLVVEEAWRNALRRGLSDTNPQDLPLYRRDFLRPLYEANRHQPLFANATGGLSERAEPLLVELRAAYQHAMDDAPYRLPRLTELETRLREQTAYEIELAIDPAELTAIALEALNAQGDLGEVARQAARRAIGLEGNATHPTLAAVHEGSRQALGETLDDEVAFELNAVHAFLSYAYDMAHANTNDLAPEVVRERGGAVAVQRERLRESFRAASGASAAAFGAQLEALVPQHPQYALLMESLARYREIVEAGGWAVVEPRSMRMGTQGARVRQLSERLRIEGFYAGEPTDRFDQAMSDAVRSYQESHQMEVTGESHATFWTSLNISARERLQQIEITLRHWRESRIPDGLDYYIFVNIPDFHAEVWRGGEVQYRFRVVVGTNERVCDPGTGTMQLAHATPLLAAQMEYLVFNPYWNVPDRILREELELELYEDPTWLHDNGFEVVVENGQSRVRQLPGADNALGAVKFVFPNMYNVYMHDTPLRRYFEFPIRDYSHGCVRVHNPMVLAETLLTNDGTWDAARVAEIQAAGVERVWRLEEPVPVFIEYYVVRVDEQGRTQFLSDVYRYDREALGILQPDRCTPPTPEPGAPTVGAVVWTPDGNAIIPDGTVIYRDGRVELSPNRSVSTHGPSGMTQDDETRPVEGDVGP